MQIKTWLYNYLLQNQASRYSILKKTSLLTNKVRNDYQKLRKYYFYIYRVPELLSARNVRISYDSVKTNLPKISIANQTQRNNLPKTSIADGPEQSSLSKTFRKSY